MTIEQTTIEGLKAAIYYYSDIEPTDEEVWEIYDIMRLNPKADLSAIISDYYNC